MHHYQFHIKDYMADTSHLDPLEDIAYRRMMDWQYLNERHLPLDVTYIAKCIRMRSHSDCIAFVLQEFFVETADGYINERIFAELEQIYEKSEKARESANARWEKEKKKNNMRSHSEGNATHNPLPNTQYISSFDEFWKIWPYKKAKKDALKAWKKLSLEKQRKAYAAVKPFWSAQKPDYYINPATWLNGDRWDDDLKPVLAVNNTQEVKYI